MVSTASDYKIKITAEGGCGPSNVEDTSDGTFRISSPYLPPEKVQY
jgi:hypothetical protein